VFLCRVGLYLSSEEKEDENGGNRVRVRFGRSGTVPTEDIRDGG